MGREVGGGIGMGKTCEPKAFSFQCMTKFTTEKKKKKTQLHSVSLLPQGRPTFTVHYLVGIISHGTTSQFKI